MGFSINILGASTIQNRLLQKTSGNTPPKILVQSSAAMTPIPTPSTTTLSTPHGILHITSTIPAASSSQFSSLPTILLIHGNSSSSRIFAHVFTSTLSQTHALLAFDLPGHGSSSNAPDPHTAYTQSSYADCALAVLSHMAVTSVVVLGWSLGGHIGIELVSKLSFPDHLPGISLLGLMIVGTPPALGSTQVHAGFKWEDGHLGAAESEVLSDAEIDGMADAACGSVFGGVPQPWMRENASRTDGRARKRMFEAFLAGEGCDQVAVVGRVGGPLLAVVNGAKEPFVVLEYVDAIVYGNLWEGKCHRIDGQGHTPFWESWEKFSPFLKRFVADCSA